MAECSSKLEWISSKLSGGGQRCSKKEITREEHIQSHETTARQDRNKKSKIALHSCLPGVFTWVTYTGTGTRTLKKNNFGGNVKELIFKVVHFWNSSPSNILEKQFYTQVCDTGYGEVSVYSNSMPHTSLVNSRKKDENMSREGLKSLNQ